MLRGLFLCAGILVACAGCGNNADSSSSAPIKLQLNWKAEPQFGGFFAAETSGAYRKHGLNVQITEGGAGAPTVQMIGAGTVPFGIVSADEIVRARAAGNRVVALFAVYQTNPQGIMTRASRGFNSIADIFSHPGTLAMERGLPYSDFLEKKYGFAKLKIVPSPFGDLSLFRTDENYAMQCFVTSEPLAAKKIGIEPKTFLIAEAGYNPYTTVLATSETYLKANPAIAQAMVSAVRQGWQAYLSDPAEANAAMEKLNATMDAQTFKDGATAQAPLIETDQTRADGLGSMTEQRWQTLIEQLADLKVVSKPISAAECFVNPKP
jgi:NitT/TauT family transport system substrate-binding protein